MITICPNLAIPQVKKEFTQLVDAIGEDNAYLVWSENRGNPITKTPQGKESKLFNTILSVADNLTDAIRLKSQIYYANFKRWYGDWKTEPSLNKDLMYTNKKGEQKSVFNYGTYISDSQYDSISFTQNKLKAEKGDRITYKIYQNDINIGFISLTRNSEKEYQVIQSKLKPEYQRKGFGTISYLKLAKQLEKKGAYLASDDLSLMNEGSVPLWQRFTAMGIAEYVRPFNYSNRDKNISGYYRFTNSSIRNERFYHGLPEGKFLNREEAIAYAKRLIPNVDASTLEFLDKLLFQERFNNDFGIFKDGKIILSEAKEGIREKVLRHEIFHKIYNDYLTENQRNELKEYYKNIFGSFPSSNIEIEEFFAKQYESYKKDKRTVKGVIKDFIEKILKFLGFIESNQYFVNELYSKIDSGFFLTQEEQEQRIKELKTYIVENFDTVENFRRVRNYLLTIINNLSKTKPLTREELRQTEIPNFLRRTTVNLKTLIDNTTDNTKKERAETMLSLLKYMSATNNYDILFRSIYPNWNFKSLGTIFEFEETNEENLIELSGVNEYQQNDDTKDQQSKTSAVIKDFFSDIINKNGVRINPKFLYFKTLILFKDLSGSNIREQIKERLQDEPSSESISLLSDKLLSLLAEVENYALIDKDGNFNQVSKKIKFTNEDTIIYSLEKKDVNELQQSSQGVVKIERRKNKNNYESTSDFIERISKETGYSIQDINNSFFYFQKSNTFSELFSHFASQTEKEFYIAEEIKVPGKGIGYIYHGISSNDSGTTYKRELRNGFSTLFDNSEYLKKGKLVGFNIHSFIKNKVPVYILNRLKSNNLETKKEGIKNILSLLKLSRYESNIDNFNNAIIIDSLAKNLVDLIELRIQKLGTRKSNFSTKEEDNENTEKEQSDIAKEEGNTTTAINIYVSIEEILEQENGTLNLFRNILNASSDYLKPTSINNMDNKKIFLFNNSSSGKTILSTLAANWSKKRTIPSHLKTAFYKYNPLAKANSIYKIITHDGLKSDFRNVPYGNESNNQWLARVFNYAFSAPIAEQTSIESNKNLQYFNFTYTPSNRPNIIGAQINLLKPSELKSEIKNAILQLKERPDWKDYKGYDRNSLINFEVLKEAFPGQFTVDKLSKMNNTEIDSLVNKIEDILNQQADKALEFFKESEFTFDANLNNTLENLYKRGYINKPNKIENQYEWVDGKRVISEKFDYNDLKSMFRIFYKNNYINSYFLNQVIVGDFAYFKNTQDIIKRLQGVLAPGRKPYINPNIGLKETFKVAIAADEEHNSKSIDEFLSEFISNEEERKGLLALFPKDYESTDAQGFMLPERRDALEAGVGQSYKLGNILKPAHYEVRVVDGKPVPIMLKYSSIVLTDKLVEVYPGLAQLRNNMRESEVDEMVFKSGTKVGAPANLNPVDKAFNEKYKFTSIATLSNDFYRLQLNPAHEVDGTVANPTQLSYFLQILSKNTKNANSLYKALASVIDTGLEEFKKQTDTKTKLINVLKELTKGSGTEAVNEFLNAGLSLDFPAITQKIVSSLASKLSKETMGARLKGSKLVLQSDIGIYKSVQSTEGMNSERAELINQQERLRYKKEGDRMYAEVMLPKDYAKYINKGDFLVHADLLGFRIPSSELHSAVPLKIVGFYDAGTLGMDNVIIAPKELVPLHGSDFDVDSLYVIRREYATRDYHVGTEERVELLKQRDSLKEKITEQLKESQISIIKQQELEDEYTLSDDRKKDIERDDFNEEYSKIGWAKRNYPNQYMYYEGQWSNYIEEFSELDRLNKEINSLKEEVIVSKNSPVGYKLENNKWVFDYDMEQSILDTGRSNIIKAYYKNMMLESFLEAVSAERNFDRMFSPISMELFKDLTNPNSIFNFIKNELGITDVFVENTDASALLDSLRIFNSSVEGNKLTGIFANIVKVFSYLSRASSENKPAFLNEDSNITIDGKELKGLKDEKHIWQILDSLLNSSIDNVKEQIIPALNITRKNVNMFSVLLGMGVDIKTLTAINLSPVMRVLTNMDGNIVKNAKALKNELFEQEEEEDIEINLSLNGLVGHIKSTKTNKAYNKDYLKSIIVAGHVDNISDIKNILNLIIETEKYTNEISKLSSIIQLIKGLPARQFEIQELLNAFDDLGATEEGNIGKETSKFNFVNLFKNNPHLLSAYKVLKHISDLLKNNIKIYSSEIDDFISEIKIPSFEFGQTEKNKHFVKQEFIKFLASSFYDFSNQPEVTNKRGMILTGSSAWNEWFINNISNLKAKYNNNTFLDGLSINFVQNKGYIITSNNTNLEYEDIIERKEDFKKLPKEIQEDFIKYAVINYGLSFGASNYTMTLPEEMVKDVDNQLNELLSTLINDERSLDNLKDLFELQLHLNFTDKYSIFRKKPTSSYGSIINNSIQSGSEYYNLIFHNKKGDYNFDKYIVKRYQEKRQDPYDPYGYGIPTGRYNYVLYKRVNSPTDPTVRYVRVGGQNKTANYHLNSFLLENGYNVDDKFRTDIPHVKIKKWENTKEVILDEVQAKMLNNIVYKNASKKIETPIEYYVRASLFDDKLRINTKTYTVKPDKNGKFKAGNRYKLVETTESNRLFEKLQPGILGIRKANGNQSEIKDSEQSDFWKEYTTSTSQSYKLQDIIDKLKKEGGNKRYTALLSFLESNLGKDVYNNGKVYFINQEQMIKLGKSKTVGGFSYRNLIYLNVDSKIGMDYVFMHELVHYFTTSLLDAKESDLTSEQLQAKANLQRLYESVYSNLINDYSDENGKLDKNKIPFRLEYGIKNLKEFVAEALTSSEFQNYINSFKVRRTQKKSLLKQFMDALKSFLGLDKVSKVSALAATFDEVMILTKEYINIDNETVFVPTTNMIETHNLEMKPFTSKKVEIEDLREQSKNVKVNPEDDTSYVNELTNKLYGRVSDTVKGLSGIISGIKRNFKYDTPGEASASRYWDKYNIDPSVKLSTDVLRGAKIDKDEYIAIKNTLVEDAKIKGNLLHKYIDAAIKQNTGRITEGNKIIDEVNKVIDEKGLINFVFRYDWINEKSENGFPSNLQKLLENVGINTLSDDILNKHKDQLESEITVVSDILGFAGTVDLLAKSYDGKFTLVDWKTGSNFDNGSIGNRLFQFGNQQNDLLDTPRNRGKLQVMLYALMLKLNNPDMQFKALHAYWMGNKRQSLEGDYKSEVEVRDFLDMIQAFFNQDGIFDEKTGKTYKEVYKEMIKSSPKIFEVSEYTGAGTALTVEKDTLNLPENELLEYYRNELNLIINSVPDKKDYTKKQKEEIKKLTQLILELEKNPNTQLSETGDISGATRWLGNLDDTSNGYIKTYKKILDQDRQKAIDEYYIKQRRFNRLLRPILEEYLGKKGMLATDRALFGALNNINTKNFWGRFYKTYEKEDITYTGLITDKDTTEWNKLSVNEKTFLKYVQSEFKSVFKGKDNIWDRKAVTASENYHEGMTVGELYNFTKKTKFYYDEFGESFLPTIPPTSEEIREKYGIFSKENWNFIKAKSFTRFYEDNYEGWSDDTEAIPLKYLGSTYVRNSEQHSLNLEKIFDRFMTNSINKKYLDHTYSIGKALQIYLEMKGGSNKDMYRNTIDMLDDKLILDILNRKKDFKFFRKGFKIGTRKDTQGNQYIEYMDFNQVLRSLKGFISAPVMWLKPIQGTRNAIFISMLNVKESVKGSIADTGLFGIDGDEVDFTAQDLAFAYKEWANMQKDFLIQRQRQNKMWLLLRKFRYLPDNYDWATNSSDLLTQKNKIIDQSSLYAFHTLPEEMHAGMIMVAQLHRMKNQKTGKSIYDSYKVEEVNMRDINNNLISSDDYHQKEFQVVWDGSVRGVIQTATNEYKEITELDAQEINKLKRVYATMHGGYRREERTAMEAYVFGELFLQFKKYLPAVLKNAFRSKGTDSSLGYYKYTGDTKDGEKVMQWIERMNEGRWRLLYRVFATYATLRTFDYSELSSQQKLQLLDAAVTLSTWFAMLIAWGQYFDDTEDENSWKKVTKFVLDNYSQQYNPEDIGRNLVQAPTTITKSFKAMINLADLSIASGQYMAGFEDNALTKRGDLRGLTEVKRTVPIIASYYDLVKFIEGDKDLEAQLFR